MLGPEDKPPSGHVGRMSHRSCHPGSLSFSVEILRWTMFVLRASRVRILFSFIELFRLGSHYNLIFSWSVSLRWCLQVRFHPSKREKLVSASVDGLMCVFDTMGTINDDEGMDSVSVIAHQLGSSYMVAYWSSLCMCVSGNERWNLCCKDRFLRAELWTHMVPNTHRNSEVRTWILLFADNEFVTPSQSLHVCSLTNT